MTNNSIKALADKYDIILGSGSPRRVQLLSETGIIFKQIIPEIEESVGKDEKPFDFALRLAREKAVSIQSQLRENQLVISCDTIVVLDNLVLGKPTDEKNAFEILSKLSGKCHTVCTALAFSDCDNILSDGYDTTSVFFNNVQPEKIMEYIKTGEPMDKAGAYGIQGMGSFLVDRIEGNLDTVIGFPRGLLNDLAERIIN